MQCTDFLGAIYSGSIINILVTEHADNISNGFFSVDIDLSSNSVTCTFYNQQNNNKKYCTVAYGPNEESCDSFTQTSYSTSNIVIVGLPSQSLSGTTYCFSVQGNNGSYTAIVEGILSQTDFNKGNVLIMIEALSTHLIYRHQ